jgi:TatD DNase family protein
VIDFHCHVDLFPDPVSLIRELEESGVYVLAVTTTPKSWLHLQQLLKNSKRIRSAVGLHPELVAQRGKEIDQVLTVMPHTRYVGEIGIDGSPEFKASFDLQKSIFARIIRESSKLGGKILSIHSRRAATPVLDSLSAETGFGQAVLHWFSGTKKELQRAVDLGCWFSVGPAMLSGEKGRELVSMMPAGRILTESDGPFAQMDNQPIKPTMLAVAETALGSIWNLSEKETGQRLMQNFRDLVDKPNKN